MQPRDVIDAALELAIVPSFSRVGPAVRRPLYGWRPPAPLVLEGRTALVTGPTSGLGRTTATQLAALGARVILLGRDATRLSGVRDELIAATGVDRFPIVVADMASLGSVRTAVGRILETENRLDVVVDNAGAIHAERRESPDGIEATLALLVAGPFTLIAGLLPLLRATSRPRVIAVTSGGMYTQPVDLEDLELESTPYSGPRAYARAKRIQVALVREWSRRLAGSGIAVNAMHPGWANTPGLAASLPGFQRVMGPLLRSAEEGTDTILWLATAPDAEMRSGRLYLDRRPRPFDRVPFTVLRAAERRHLWDAVVSLAGIPDPAPDLR